MFELTGAHLPVTVTINSIDIRVQVAKNGRNHHLLANAAGPTAVNLDTNLVDNTDVVLNVAKKMKRGDYNVSLTCDEFDPGELITVTGVVDFTFNLF